MASAAPVEEIVSNRDGRQGSFACNDRAMLQRGSKISLEETVGARP